MAAQMAHTVLVVEDESSYVEALMVGLGRAGFRVVVATDGAEALARFDSVQPDVVLLDVMLPGANVLDILQHVRRNPVWQAMAIIMLTPKGRDVEAKKGLALGANAYVIKPFSTSDLLAEVHRCLDGGSPSASPL